jgi:hypothetical protein
VYAATDPDGVTIDVEDDEASSDEFIISDIVEK